MLFRSFRTVALKAIEQLMYHSDPSLLNNGHERHLVECFANIVFHGAGIALVEYLCQGALDLRSEILGE